MGPRSTLQRTTRLVVCVSASALALSLSFAAAHAQPIGQVASVAALARYGAFYTDKTVVVRGRLKDANGRLSFEDDEGNRIRVAWKDRDRPDGPVDATGVVWDLGRMKPDDPQLVAYDLRPIVGTSGQEWPKPGEVFLLAVSRFVPADTDRGLNPGETTVRSLVLEGARAAGRQVTVVGQFHGRNLFGELPRSPGVSRWDFVVSARGAALWVTGKQPRGKDFEFNPDQRIDSNRWLEVTGTVRESEGLMYIQATKLSLAKQPVTQTTDSASQPKAIRPFPPPEVLFSIPVEGERDVSPTTTVRIQLSRGLDRASLANHMRIGYFGAAPGSTPPIQSTAELEERNAAPGGAVAVLVIRFAQPLERFRTVRIDLLDGIKATDGQPLKPWSLTFTVGGQQISDLSWSVVGDRRAPLTGH